MLIRTDAATAAASRPETKNNDINNKTKFSMSSSTTNRNGKFE